MIKVLILFSQLYISGGGRCETISTFYYEPRYCFGASGILLFREESSKMVPQISASYLWNEEGELRGWKIKGTLWKIKGKMKTGIYPGFGATLLNYKYKDYYLEKVTLVLLDASILINIKFQNFGIGITGTVGFPFYFFLFIIPTHFEIGLQVYRLPE